MKQDICCWSWLKKEGRELPKAENWPGCDNTVTNPELSGGQIPLQDKYCHKSVAQAARNPFFSARDLKAATGFPGQKDTIILRLKAAGLRARHAAVKDILTDEHKLHHFAFAESNVDHKWDWVIFTDESTFTSANDGPVLV